MTCPKCRATGTAQEDRMMAYPGNNKLTLCPAAMEAVIQEWMNRTHVGGNITVTNVEQSTVSYGAKCFEITFTDEPKQEPKS